MICLWCGCTFDRPNRRGPKPRYCKPSHRQRAYTDRHMLRSATDDGLIAEVERRGFTVHRNP